jgi:hypothetical protein
LLDRAAQVMAELRSVHFFIERTGAPAFLDPGNTFAFRRAEGDFVSPDQARVTVRVIGPAIVTDVNAISLGDRYWETQPLTGEWVEYDTANFDPVALLHPQTGLVALMRDGLSDVTYVGVEELEELPGQLLHHISATAPGEPMLAMTAGLVGRGQMTFDWWIEPDSLRLLRLLAVETETDPADPTTWLVEFDHFDEPVTITPP